MSEAPREILISPESPHSLYFTRPAESTIHEEVRYIRADLYDAEIAALKQALALNARLLARQCDMAREAETETARLREALKEILTMDGGETQDVASEALK